MCGRAAQTQNAVFAAATHLCVQHPQASPSTNNDATDPPSAGTESLSAKTSHEWGNNYNMSPGMDAMVFFKDGDNNIRMERKVWGLISRGGTTKNPLPTTGMMNLHFQSQMYNARSDTLFTKTFARLANSGQSCLIALDGFFEWKDAALKGGKRQPYFVHRKNDQQRPYLLMAGLWKSVPTGRTDDPTLELFTILTTEACKPVAWLHHRMPLLIWDEELAFEWLDRPTETTLKQLEQSVSQTSSNVLGWHQVTTDMNSIKFRDEAALKPLPKTKTLKSFFAAGTAAKPKDSSSKKSTKDKTVSHQSESKAASPKRPPESASSPPLEQKKRKADSSKKDETKAPKKMGPLDSFFGPKK